MNLQFVFVHVIFRVTPAECAICIPVAVPQEYVIYIYIYMRGGRIPGWGGGRGDLWECGGKDVGG